MENLTKESILKAIQKIDSNPNLIKGRESFQYDLVYNGKKYPPILVLSEANKILGGEEITIRDFNNSTKRAFKILVDKGFEVLTKNIDVSNIWFVCQGSTFTNEIGKKFLWAPKLDKAGNPKFFWDNMKRVKKGDIIFNYSKGIKGVSMAINDSYESNNVENQSSWGKEGFRVDIDFFEFDKDIKIEDLKSIKPNLQLALSGIEKKPFNSNGGVNQGYLYEFSPEAGKLIIELYGKSVDNGIIDKYFNNIDLPNNVDLHEEPKISTGNNANFNCSEFNESLIISGLLFSPHLTSRFISSLLTKPFVILSGLSGSGKTKVAQAFVQWICADEDQYKIVPVGADWTNREPLLGYPNALDNSEYIKPENGVVDLILHAQENDHLPHFLILDEMNLSHVERYFADFLSVMESNGEITFHSGTVDKSGVPASIPMPDNLFIIGTINVDETTYMFSPKVLDRANVIEFRITEKEIEQFLERPVKPDLKQLKGAGAGMAENFLEMARTKEFESPSNGELNKALLKFFGELKKTGAEFGYRSAFEIHRLINQLSVIDSDLKDKDKMDIAIMQKLLPKLHGSRRKLCPILITLGNFCIEAGRFEKIEDNIFLADEFDFQQGGINYPVSLEKIARMYKGAVDNGFASYAEA